jgi:hypothetical protein
MKNAVYIYLHTNGSVIVKPAMVVDTPNMGPEKYFESDFVLGWWAIPADKPAPTPEGCVEFMMAIFDAIYDKSTNKEQTKADLESIAKGFGFIFRPKIIN